MNIDNLFQNFPQFEAGQVWLAGAGPGRLGMVTLECVHAIQTCDTIIYDALVNAEILEWAREETDLIFAGKRGGACSTHQEDITQLMIDKAKQGGKILRLKGGDPLTFARGGEEALRLTEAHIDFRILPGITAGIGGLAAAGIPLTQREANVNVMFLTGHALTGKVPHQLDWHAIAKAADVMVWYMAHKHFAEIVANLLEAGRSENDAVAFVSHASTAKQKILITNLKHAICESEKVETPVIIAIGPIVGLQPILAKHFLPSN